MSDLLPEQVPPEQPPLLQSEGHRDDGHSKLTCTPPFGQSTIIPKEQHSVKFTVLLGSSDDQEKPEVSVWHNHNGEHDWAELRLKATIDDEKIPIFSQASNRNSTRIVFTGELSGLPKHGHLVNFTIKSRPGPNGPWRWIKDSTGISDGSLHYQSCADFTKHNSYELKHWFDDISSDIKVSYETPETEKTQLYSLTCPVNAAKDPESGYQHHILGKARHASKWFALVRLWSPWLAPRQGPGDKFELDKDGILLSFLRTDGLHVVCLGISGVHDIVTTFLHDEHGNVVTKGRNDREDTGTSTVLVAVAESFEVANSAVMYHARKVIAEYGSTESSLAADTEEIKALTDSKVRPEWLEEWYDGLTYCTWNGLGQGLTEQKLHDALDDLSKNDINITNLIIDDNWQSLSTGENQFKRGWSDFEANPSGFPDGMKKTTTEIRKRHPNVNHIAVWHAILGYWGGIDPDGKLAEKYKTIKVEKEPGVAGGTFTVVAPEDAKQFYDDFYAFLSESGVDSVKTDAQFFLDLLVHAPDRRKMITEYQDAWTLAHLRHFSSRAISCMSQFPQALFHSQLPKNKPRLLVRNSDDFFPEVEASHAWHIFCNAHNSLLTQHLNALPDWDMFQTSHDWAAFHAAARCVSGGPIYFTDVPGQHDIKLIRQMTAQTLRGTTVILRPHIVGKAMNPYNFYGDQAVLKIGTYVGMAKTGTGILGCFNVCGQTLNEFVHLQDFPGTDEGEYVIGSFRSGGVGSPVKRGDQHAMVGIELATRGWDILTAYAVRSFEIRSKTVKVGTMGLLGKMTGAAAVTGTDMYVESNGRLRIWTSIKALGMLGIWVSDLEERTVEDDFMVMILGRPVPRHCVEKNKACDKVLEVDVETAWKEMGFKAGWTNEVSLEIFVH